MEPKAMESYGSRLAKARAEWPAGPWTEEPDRLEWRRHGMPCLVLRNGQGAWCGYVGVAPGHPLHGVEYGQETPALAEALEKRKGSPIGANPSMAIMLACLSGEVKPTPDLVIQVHGGLTFSSACRGPICHVPAEGEPENVWWFGFDCIHSGDISPFDAVMARDRPEWFYKLNGHDVYRDIVYARAETESLADQLQTLNP